MEERENERNSEKSHARGWTRETSGLREKVRQCVEIRRDKVACKSIKPVRGERRFIAAEGTTPGG